MGPSSLRSIPVPSQSEHLLYLPEIWSPDPWHSSHTPRKAAITFDTATGIPCVTESMASRINAMGWPPHAPSQRTGALLRPSHDLHSNCLYHIALDSFSSHSVSKSALRYTTSYL